MTAKVKDDWDTTPDLFEPLQAEVTTPEQWLELAELVQPNDERRLNHALFGDVDLNIMQALHIDFSNPEINGTKYHEPLLLPLCNGKGELKQVAIMELGKRIYIPPPDHKPRAFARFGSFEQSQPIFITYDLFNALKLADNGYNVALCILGGVLSGEAKNELAEHECNLIKSVCSQLSKAGYKRLYMVSYSKDHPKPHDALKTAVASYNVRFIDSDLDIVQKNNSEVQTLIDEALQQDGYVRNEKGLNTTTDIQANNSVIEQITQQDDCINSGESDQTENEILRLANLDEIAYEQQRKAVAEALGMRATHLDKFVKAKRKELLDQVNEDEFFDHVEAWHEAVDGAQLLDSIYDEVNKHIACEKQTAIAVSLWTLFTWCIDGIHIAPIACITAPEKRCGKTQLLSLIGELCYKPLIASNISPSGTFRSIQDWKPTLLLDEADAFLKDNEEMRGVINAGHSRKNAFVIRCVGDNHTPTRFNVFCAKAISGIGHLPETIKDRSIILELRRKLPSEQKQRLRHADPSTWHTIKRKCLRWANDNMEAIKIARPTLPEALNDRAQDNWESLLIIAELCSEAWLEKANFSALAINGIENEAPSINEQLLSDIQQIFKIHNDTKIFSVGLLEALTKDDESMWSTWNRGKPISPHQLATRLSHFGIKSKDVRIATVVKKGFTIEQFKDAFNRYLPKNPSQTATTLQPNDSKACSGFQTATESKSVADKNSSKALQGKECSGVAFQTPPTADNTVKRANRNTKAQQQNATKNADEQDNQQMGLTI